MILLYYRFFMVALFRVKRLQLGLSQRFCGATCYHVQNP